MNIEIRDPAFRIVIGDSVVLEQLGTDFEFTEGPIWHHIEKTSHGFRYTGRQED